MKTIKLILHHALCILHIITSSISLCEQTDSELLPKNEQEILVDSYLTLSEELQTKKEYKTALIYLKEAARLRPSDPSLTSAASLLLAKLDPKDAAFNIANSQTVEPMPNEQDSLADMYIATANSLRESQNHAQAILYTKEALRIRPDNAHLMFDLANTLNMANENDESLFWYYKLLDKFPTNKTILYNTAYTLKKINRVDEAMVFYNASLEQDPEYAEARFSRGLAYLTIGDWDRGWPEYEYRWKRPGYPPQRTLSEPMLDKDADLNGKIVYLYAEQGLGDTFQFIRYARILKNKGARVVVSVQNPLLSIIALCPYIDKVIAMNQQPVKYDYQAPLMTLPYILKTTVETTPNVIPYLYASASLEHEWKQKLSHEKRVKIGICWQGNANYRTAALRSVVAAKSIPAVKFAKLCQVPHIKLYSLQKETGVDQAAALPPEIHIFDDSFDSTNGRFMDTAAVLKNMDLFITVDTSMAHLAAGLGIETWVFLPEPADWRWMLYTAKTPWYPNMRLFRQETAGNWDQVFETIKQELVRFVEQKTGSSLNNGE